jgi:hypothetical protein
LVYRSSKSPLFPHAEIEAHANWHFGFGADGRKAWNGRGKIIMGDSVVESLILDLLEWLVKRDRSYEEVMDE